jgi:hypothetical protein
LRIKNIEEKNISIENEVCGERGDPSWSQEDADPSNLCMMRLNFFKEEKLQVAMLAYT